MGVIYESANVTLVCGDATDPAVIDAAPTADLLATDPPYGVRWQSGFRTQKFPELAGDDGTLEVPAVLGAWTRRLKDKRHAYVFGYRPDQLADQMRLGGTAELVWDKMMMGLGDLSLPWGPSHERVTFGVHIQGKSDRESGRGRLSARLRSQSVLAVPRNPATRHSTEKPAGLMAQLIESSTLRGDLVLDPFAGSGSTLVAAVLTGRCAYGVELDPEYAKVAADRLHQAEAAMRSVAPLM